MFRYLIAAVAVLASSPAFAAGLKAECRFVVYEHRTQTFERVFNAESTGDSVTIDENVELGGITYAFHFNATTAFGSGVSLYIMDANTRQRYAINNGGLVLGAPIYAGADQPTPGGLRGVDALCYVTE